MIVVPARGRVESGWSRLSGHEKQLTTEDKGEREKVLGEAQTAVAKDLSTLPLLQGAQLMVAGADVKGVEQTLDASFKTRLGVISK